MITAPSNAIDGDRFLLVSKFFFLQENLRKFNEKYMKKWLLSPNADTSLTKLFEKIAITWVSIRHLEHSLCYVS